MLDGVQDPLPAPMDITEPHVPKGMQEGGVEQAVMVDLPAGIWDRLAASVRLDLPPLLTCPRRSPPTQRKPVVASQSVTAGATRVENAGSAMQVA